MPQEVINQWAALGKNALDSMKELGEINTKIVERLAEQQRAILNIYLEAGSKEIELISGVKDAKELLTGQSTLATEYNNKLVEIIRGMQDFLSECRNELTTWAEKGMEKTVAQFTQPPSEKK
jgi:hypothetical protein